jgi:hypothetical protein
MTEQERQALLRTLGGQRVKLVRQGISLARQIRWMTTRIAMIDRRLSDIDGFPETVTAFPA